MRRLGWRGPAAFHPMPGVSGPLAHLLASSSLEAAALTAAGLSRKLQVARVALSSGLRELHLEVLQVLKLGTFLEQGSLAVIHGMAGMPCSGRAAPAPF